MIRSKQIFRKRLVLVVDDQETNRDALGITLEEEYEVIYACDGREALEKIKSNIEDLSIILLDLIMPVMNGFEVLEAMNADEAMHSIPVIVLTAEKNAELKALQMGAADFITKPFDMHEVILARVERIIELSEGRHLISAAERDSLTGLYSRNFFFEYANRLFMYHSEMCLDSIVLDIEQFHSLNALSGREFGDEVLKNIGDEIRAFLSQTEGIAGRLEADTFEIYCVHRDDYAEVLGRFQDRVNALSSNVRIRLRMGVMPWHEGVDPVVSFDCARADCNAIRGDFKRSLMIYDGKMRERELLNQRLLNDLRSSIDARQFVVYYQPKYNIKCDPPKLSSAEALIRWDHPELGMISPGSFIPLFEGNGLISIIDDFVWNEASRQIAQWKEKYGITLPVSVNLSRADVYDPELVEKLKKIVQNNGFEFSDLKLEVTESASTDNANQLLDVIWTLRNIGFDIEMDDFGSGYSSLNMLSTMPVDVLKVDMKFIRNLETSETDRRLVKLIIDIAKYLKVMVVAEGVETEGQLEILKKDGCDLVQGYYFSKPLPPAEFEKLIEREIALERI
ncbi:MAG: EAL domain-containing protein [Clostridia bacterium]|nr:EAL domain-containing protein [Clostridia bacterium]